MILPLENLLITLNNRLATAAAAIVQRIISRRMPRVFRPVSPSKKGSMEDDSGIVKDMRLRKKKTKTRCKSVLVARSCLRLKIKVLVFRQPADRLKH